MTEREASKLGERELDIMNALWELGGGTVSEVHGRLRGEGLAVAYTTVQTMMNRLEAKGHVSREMVGRAYRYTPRLRQPAAAGSALEALISRFFDGSAEQLARHLVEKDLSSGELERVRKLIATKKRRDRS